MTVYAAASRQRAARLRPTLRLRLTLLNGILLVGAGAMLVLLAWLLVGDALHPADGSARLDRDAGRRHAGRRQQWQSQLVDARLAGGAGQGPGWRCFAIGVIGIAGAYAVAGRALRPLHRVTPTAQRLGEETLDQRIRYAGADDEVAELARTFDAMLDRLAAAFESQKRFVANASHELRTPLAVMRTEIDVTLSDDEADVAEYRRMAKVVRNASERANGAGRRAAGAGPLGGAVGPAAGPQGAGRPGRPACDNALSAVAAEAERLKLDVTTDLRPAPVVGDPSLLDRLAGNLIENAIRYNHLLGRLWLRTEPVDGQARLIVGNTGYEVEPADVPGLFEPFRRGGWERTGSRGSGLGLSIVRAVCDAHGGTVSAVAQDGGGLEVTVSLPAAATTPVVAATASGAPDAAFEQPRERLARVSCRTR